MDLQDKLSTFFLNKVTTASASDKLTSERKSLADYSIYHLEAVVVVANLPDAVRVARDQFCSLALRAEAEYVTDFKTQIVVGREGVLAHYQGAGLIRKTAP